MTIEPHVMPREHLIALARGDGGVEAIESLVAAQHSRNLILLRGVRQAARAAAQHEGRLAEAGYGLLALVQQHDPGTVSAIVRYPSVGAWALRTVRDDYSLPGAGPGGLAAVAAAAAIRAGLAAEIEVPVTDGRAVLPSLGAADAEGTTAVVRTHPAEVRSAAHHVAVSPGAPGWHELRRIRAGKLDVLIDDLDPFRMPGSDGEPTGRLPDPQVAELEASLRGAWEVLAPGSAAEIAALVQVIVPYQAPDGGYVSTSSPETFGTVALSRPPDRYTCAETLVHEAQHLKLCALLDLVRLTNPDDGQRYYAPWRDDPRPAGALLHGAYAFLGVSGFWRQHRHTAPDPAVRQRADAEFARWRDGSALAVATLAGSGQLTPDGQDFVAEMTQVLDSWRQEPVSAEAQAVARRKADLHHARWRAGNDGSSAVSPPGQGR